MLIVRMGTPQSLTVSRKKAATTEGCETPEKWQLGEVACEIRAENSADPGNQQRSKQMKRA
jgi:hypothetical protein